jgi:hypothetical protein
MVRLSNWNDVIAVAVTGGGSLPEMAFDRRDHAVVYAVTRGSHSCVSPGISGN